MIDFFLDDLVSLEVEGAIWPPNQPQNFLILLFGEEMCQISAHDVQNEEIEEIRGTTTRT